MKSMQLRTSLAVTLAVAAAIIMPSAARAQGGFDGPGRYEIINVNSGKALELDRGDKTTVLQSSPRNTDSQQWDAHPADPGYWVLRNVHTGAALECVRADNAMPVRGVPFTQSPGQQWQIQPANDGNALIVSRIGRVALDIPQRSRADGARVQTYPVNGDPNQRFMFRLISKPTASPEQVRERYRNRAEDQAHSGFYDERDHTWKMEGDGVCFYRGPNYTSKAFCVRLGENVPNVPQDWLEVFRSVKFFGNVRAVVAYRDPGFAGRRVRIVHDEPDLELYRSEQGDVFERQVRSLRLF